MSACTEAQNRIYETARLAFLRSICFCRERQQCMPGKLMFVQSRAIWKTLRVSVVAPWLRILFQGQGGIRPASLTLLFLKVQSPLFKDGTCSFHCVLLQWTGSDGSACSVIRHWTVYIYKDEIQSSLPLIATNEKLQTEEKGRKSVKVHSTIVAWNSQQGTGEWKIMIFHCFEAGH